MEPISLRQTLVPVSRKTRAFDPTELFMLRDRMPWFWFLVAAAVTVVAAWDRHQLIARFKERERVVIIDQAGTYYLSPLFQFQEASALHIQQAELATVTFLARNPRDFDQPELLKQLFLRKAYGQALDQRAREGVEFKAKGLHQKPEIGKVEILATREDSVLASVTGQLIRTGTFQDKAFTEGLVFTLKLNLVRNPNLAHNGRFPMAVAEFKYEVNP